jgi:Uma2 family endonuclease
VRSNNLDEDDCMPALAKAKRRLRIEDKEHIFDTLPNQGNWTDEDYLRLTDATNRLVEFTDGYLEPLPLPTTLHQVLLKNLFIAVHTYLEARGGVVMFAALRLRLRIGKFREPDLLAVLDAADPRREDRFWLGADWVAEVVSKDKPSRHLVDKKRDYAQACVPEYWIVNPLNETVIVYRLEGKRYLRHGRFRRGQKATSALLPWFSIDVTTLFDAE